MFSSIEMYGLYFPIYPSNMLGMNIPLIEPGKLRKKHAEILKSSLAICTMSHQNHEK